MSAVRPDARTFAERVVEVCGADSERASGWEVTEDPGGQPWVYARHEKSAAPPQGWKLHVSATVSSAPVVVERVLDELMRDPAAFKVSASPAALAALNQGQAGLSQDGKFKVSLNETKGQLHIKADGKLLIEAQSLEIKVDTDAKLSGTGVSLEASGQMSVEGDKPV